MQHIHQNLLSMGSPTGWEYMGITVIYEGICDAQQANRFLQAPKLHSSSKPFCCSTSREEKRKREKSF